MDGTVKMGLNVEPGLLQKAVDFFSSGSERDLDWPGMGGGGAVSSLKSRFKSKCDSISVI